MLNKWQQCTKCSSLWFRGDAVCHGNQGGLHEFSNSSTYILSCRVDAPGQDKWKWCSKCLVFSYTGLTIGPCEAGGTHDVSASGNYCLASSGGKQTWRWCSKCQALAFSADAACVADGGKHDFSASGEYSIGTETTDPNAKPLEGEDRCRWCQYCETMCYDSLSSCPSGSGAHASAGNTTYTANELTGGGRPVDASEQAGWGKCGKCLVLAYAGGQADAGSCARGGMHDFRGGGEYAVYANVPPKEGNLQGGWAWCQHCQQMWYTEGGAKACPATKTGHSKDGSSDYLLQLD